MLPPAWQMHLLSKSWWIFSLNSKQNRILPFLSQCKELLCLSCFCLTPAITHSQRSNGLKHCFGFFCCHMLRLCDEWQPHTLLFTSYGPCLGSVVLFIQPSAFPLQHFQLIAFSPLCKGMENVFWNNTCIDEVEAVLDIAWELRKQQVGCLTKHCHCQALANQLEHRTWIETLSNLGETFY